MTDFPRETMTPKPGRLFCFGLGYCARNLARTLRAEGWAISGTCRTPERQAKLQARGITAHLFSPGHGLDDPEAALDGVTHVLHSIPPDADGDIVLREHGVALAQLPRLQWFGYLSTTGVYGDRGGEWVDEESDLRPSGERGRRRVTAEAGWGALVSVGYFPLHIFRLAGIYGPRRNPLDNLRDGSATRVIKPGQVFGRIHVDDIVQVLRASMARPFPGAVYNVCDDDPAPPWEVLEYGAELLGIAPPAAVPFEQAQLSEMARSFYDDNKRVRNDRIKTELGVQLKYPSYRDGLRALLQSPAAPRRRTARRGGQPVGAPAQTTEE
jgi:nucleoside-diphosphate-sugar epimerase